MSEAGFNIVMKQRTTKLGSIGWFVSGRILGRRHLSPRQMIWFDRLLPVAKILEYLLPIPGMSLTMVGQKPIADAISMPVARQLPAAAAA